jgi:CRP-like cAMP-binding protein
VGRSGAAGGGGDRFARTAAGGERWSPGSPFGGAGPDAGDSDSLITSPRLELIADLPDGVEETGAERIEPTHVRESRATDPDALDDFADFAGYGEDVADYAFDPEAAHSLGARVQVRDSSRPRRTPTPRPRPRSSSSDATEPAAVLEALRRTEIPAGESQGDLLAAFDRPAKEMFRPRARRPSFIERSLRLFPGMPEEAVDELVANVIHRKFESGEIILREGEPGDACFLLTSGMVRVLKRDPLAPRGDLIEVTRLEQGQLFGEFAVLADRRRHATVQADGVVRVLEISRQLLRSLVKGYPEMKPILDRYFRERMVSNLLATAPFLRAMPEERRESLLAEFVPVRVESGEAIVRQGERAGGFYLIVLGGVEISKELSPERTVLLATLGEGAYFGVLSLLRGDVARAGVIATGPTELAMLPPQSFYDLLAELPVLWDEVRREADRRELEMYEIVAGVTGSV